MDNSPLSLYQLGFLVSYVILAALFYRFAVRQWETNVVDDRLKLAGRPYYLLIILTFSGGALARTIQQLTGSELADALVPIFGGFFALAIGWPLLFLPRQQLRPLAKRMLYWGLAALVVLLAIACFFIGLTQLLSILQ